MDKSRDRPVLMKFCRVVQTASPERTVGHILKFRKFKMAAAAILKNRKIAISQ